MSTDTQSNTTTNNKTIDINNSAGALFYGFEVNFKTVAVAIAALGAITAIARYYSSTGSDPVEE